MKRFFLSVLLSCCLSCNQLSAKTVESAVQLLEAGQVQEGLALLKKKAKARNAKALFYLGNYYLYQDKIVHEDVERAWKYIKKSATLRFPPALTLLAGEYLNGDYLKHDALKAAKLYREAADLGYGPAQFNYGILLKNGEGVTQDFVQAFCYLALAALNTQDLDMLTEDATFYRDQIYEALSPQERKKAYQCIARKNHSAPPSRPSANPARVRPVTALKKKRSAKENIQQSTQKTMWIKKTED